MTDPAATPVATAPRPRTARYPSTALALIGSVIGCLGIVAFIILVVVRPDAMSPRTVDWVAAAQESGDPALLAPELPEGWSANYAELVTDGDTRVWRVGFVSPAGGFVGMSEALAGSDAWVAAQVGDAGTGGSVGIDGLRWTTVDRRGERDPGNRAYTMVTRLDPPDTRAIALYGTGSDEEFRVVANAVAAAVRASR
ncbi:MAG: hypothetical protein BGO95_09495 [Micrococcales bacterium 73-13]|nr:MAG: hypothetical protein BGO95_09495 [Micrococcales bacterium 73-13]